MWHKRKWLGEYYIWLLGMGLVLTGCRGGYVAGRSADELIRLVGDYQLADRRRLSVIDEVLSQPLNQEQEKALGRQLAEVISSPRHSPVIRRRALPVIFQRYREEAAPWLGAALLNTNEREMRADIIAALVKLKDKRALPYLVIAGGAEQQTPPQPPELIPKAVEKIAEKPMESVLVEQIRTGTTFRVRIAALAGLKRRLGLEEAISVLLKLENQDDFINLVQFWAGRFGYIPTNTARLFICRKQQTTLTASSWDELQGHVGLLGRRHGYRFDVRDSHILLKVAKNDLEQAPGEWAGKITRRLARLNHTKRPAGYPGAGDDYQEDFVGQRNLFSYTDLIRIELLLETLAQPETVKRLRRFLQDDLADLETEAGGLCFLDSAGKVEFEPYLPGRRMGDNLYIESAEMTRQGALCLARWHCHADRRRTKELAGPGADDLQYAAYYDCPLVVVTYINDKILNLDYCTPEGVVVDLGNY